jgi:hypothetical protein
MSNRAKRYHAVNPNSRIAAGLKFKFGLSLEQYNEMFTAQGGKCKICGTHQLELKRRLAVDHDHNTGKIRGLLCQHCNLVIGLALDSTTTLESAIEYLKSSRIH